MIAASQILAAQDPSGPFLFVNHSVLYFCSYFGTPVLVPVPGSLRHQIRPMTSISFVTVGILKF